MGRIRVLPTTLINRIAAGECVERPASVVKELVENALDAGAAKIDVQILDGGRELIQVSDNGSGMDADDLQLSVQPHATSKIRADDDLFNIHTMGFRGEALPSIAAVSRLKIVSRPAGEDVGHMVRVEGGELTGPTPCMAPVGTMVEVRDLFYCVPARQKFLRTTQAEMGHITEQLARIALAYPGVAFSLKHQKRVVHDLIGVNDRLQRIADFFGQELGNVLLPIRRETNGVLLEGHIAPPRESRASGKWEYVFVNGRYIRDKFVSHAIKEAYRSLIDPSRFPVAFLFITLDPAQVDVNVHPSKIEVRWRDSNFIHSHVLAALRDKFLSSNLAGALRTTPGDDDAYRQRVRDAMVDFFTKSRPPAGPRSMPAETIAANPQKTPTEPLAAGNGPREPAYSTPAQNASTEASPPNEPYRLVAQANQCFLETPPANAPLPSSTDAPLSPPSTDAPGNAATPSPISNFKSPSPPLSATMPADLPARELARRSMQIHNAYLLVEMDDGLTIIDQHALHERILYEELCRRVKEQKFESQRLLIPEVIRVPADRIEALETHADLLTQLGIELTPSGPQSVTLHAFPSFLERLDRIPFVRDLLDVLSKEGDRPATDALAHELLATMACKAAVKFGDPLTPTEIDALLALRDKAERSSHCPHGRPTTLHLTLRDLERQFKRR